MSTAISRPVWLVTGCSSGIGRALAQHALACGRKVAVTARNAESIAYIAAVAPGNALALPLDVADPASVQRAVAATLARFGRIDVLVNNAGIGLSGAVEESSAADVDRIYQTNVFGPLNLIRAVLPQMRARRDGHLIGVSSIGGIRGSRGVGIYNSSKFALEGLHEALAQELAPLGIDVTIIEPGVVRTDFRLRSISRAEGSIDDYAATAGLRRAGLEAGYKADAASPEIVAQTLFAALDSGRKPPLRLPLGADCVAALRTKAEAMLAELAAWEDYAQAPTTGVLPRALPSEA